jgi:hypothetical protein
MSKERLFFAFICMACLSCMFIGLLIFLFSMGWLWGMIGAPIYILLWLCAFNEARLYVLKGVSGKGGRK